MLSLKEFKEVEIKKSQLDFLYGGEWDTKYTASNGTSGKDTWCDENGNGKVDHGDQIELDTGEIINY